ncbi:hypothetical protein Srufu_066550 [Streptomyces libani subsp. rufus]|nr:hypothetical protein Srufu_066550 [Streptomyces libani subsp. rufus]
MLHDVQVLDVVDHVLGDRDGALVGELALRVRHGHAVDGETALHVRGPLGGERDVDIAVIDGGFGVVEDAVAVRVVARVRAVEVMAVGGTVEVLSGGLAGHEPLGLDLHGQLPALEAEHRRALGTGVVQLRQVDLERSGALGDGLGRGAYGEGQGGGQSDDYGEVAGALGYHDRSFSGGLRGGGGPHVVRVRQQHLGEVSRVIRSRNARGLVVG